MPPNAAMIGTAALRMDASSPTRTSRLIAFSCLDKLSKAVLSDLYLSMIFSLAAAKMLNAVAEPAAMAALRDRRR